MDEQSSGTKKLQWKWVGLTFLFYLVLYPLPFVAAHFLLAQRAEALFIGIWLFAGISIMGAIAGYLSEGVTLWEPAIAAAGFIGFFFLVVAILAGIFGGGPAGGTTWFQSVLQILVIVVAFFCFSLLGAWIGERAQKLRRIKSPQSK